MAALDDGETRRVLLCPDCGQTYQPLQFRGASFDRVARLHLVEARTRDAWLLRAANGLTRGLPPQTARRHAETL
jgi:hypothetical protein